MPTSERPVYGMETDCLHCANSDGAFIARMRFHQSWYRRHVLYLPPGPNPYSRGTIYGNMLRDEDGRAGWNFLTSDIHACAETRLQEKYGVIVSHRLHNNLLSSQPMCFNLLAPLADNLDLATQLVALLPGIPAQVQVTRVAFEFAPAKQQHLQDNSAFDAFIEYQRPNGHIGFIGIETKLTEPFTKAEYPFDMRYRRWQQHSTWWWNDGAEQSFPDLRINQLWRNHLLAFSILHQDTPQYDEGYYAVIYHEGDPTCPEALDLYRQLLRPAAQHTLVSWTLDELMTLWSRHPNPRPVREWLNGFRLRYLDLEASQPAYDQFRRNKNESN